MAQDLQEHHRRAARIESLIQEIAAFSDPQARATTEELVQTLLDMYGAGLSRLLELTAQTQAVGPALIEVLASDELVSALFMLHGLHPIDLQTRIAGALEEVRPYLKSHGGNVEILSVEDGVAHLRLEGSCHGCPSSAMTLKLAIEEAIYKAAPDLDELKVDGVLPPKPVTFIPRRPKESTRPTQQDGGWSVVEGPESLLAGSVREFAHQGEHLLFCRIDTTYYAYHNRCSKCTAPLADGIVMGTSLTCPSCALRYDICHAGKCLDAPNLFLEPVPLLVESGKVKVALPTLPAHAL